MDSSSVDLHKFYSVKQWKAVHNLVQSIGFRDIDDMNILSGDDVTKAFKQSREKIVKIREDALLLFGFKTRAKDNWCGYTIKSGRRKEGPKDHRAGFITQERIMAFKQSREKIVKIREDALLLFGFKTRAKDNWCGYTIKSGRRKEGPKDHRAGFITQERIMVIKLNVPNYHPTDPILPPYKPESVNETQELFDSIPMCLDTSSAITTDITISEEAKLQCSALSSNEVCKESSCNNIVEKSVTNLSQLPSSKEIPESLISLSLEYLIKNESDVDTLIFYLQEKFNMPQERLEKWKNNILFEMRDNRNYWKKERESMNETDFLKYKQNFEAKMKPYILDKEIFVTSTAVARHSIQSGFLGRGSPSKNNNSALRASSSDALEGPPRSPSKGNNSALRASSSDALVWDYFGTTCLNSGPHRGINQKARALHIFFTHVAQKRKSATIPNRHIVCRRWVTAKIDYNRQVTARCAYHHHMPRWLLNDDANAICTSHESLKESKYQTY
ncbi:hypothetical protein Glove_406g24 [Diversispora epigaea]|uniref:Uncharacterized protein n=1 Tax=Diversispora epigaea TaxID=1348612 RepID=A0A397H6R6_9GLOM|nr:hypothetical protein Glove_406g24 [Diversispora epigaea]